jgi:hypothetical protein
MWQAGGCTRCWVRWGGDFGRDILYLGVAGLDTPIWDVLAPEGEQEEALNHLRMGSISPGFPIRQAVPLGLAWARFCCWACCARFFIEKKVDCSKYSIFTCNLVFSKCLGR